MSMAELRVKTRLSLKEVKRRFAALPAILSGQALDPLGLRPIFFAIFARRLYELIHMAYVIKAEGGTDSLGNTWRALRPRTIKKRISKSFLDKYPMSARLLINRVTDRLLDSFKPGTITGNAYIPPANQKYVVEINRMILGSDVPYAGAVHKRRRLWPARMKDWIRDATNVALDRVFEILARSLANAK